MRIIAGAWRGRALTAPPGVATRPTADRVRQALFDMLMHAPWAGRDMLAQARVLDVFAGTGALGLEALSRGAQNVVFFENDPLALTALRANIAACRAGDRSRVMAADAVRPGPWPSANPRHNLVFLDPPYDQGLVQRALNVLRAQGWLAPDALIVAETSRLETVVESVVSLALREHGAARINVWRE